MLCMQPKPAALGKLGHVCMMPRVRVTSTIQTSTVMAFGG